MPIYEYKCKKCGYGFEQLQKMTEEPLTVCPSCEAAQLVKLISNTSFQLKGTGWYATDFKDKNKSGKSTKNNGKKEPAPIAKVDAGVGGSPNVLNQVDTKTKI